MKKLFNDPCMATSMRAETQPDKNSLHFDEYMGYTAYSHCGVKNFYAAISTDFPSINLKKLSQIL